MKSSAVRLPVQRITPSNDVPIAYIICMLFPNIHTSWSTWCLSILQNAVTLVQWVFYASSVPCHICSFSEHNCENAWSGTWLGSYINIGSEYPAKEIQQSTSWISTVVGILELYFDMENHRCIHVAYDNMNTTRGISISKCISSKKATARFFAQFRVTSAVSVKIIVKMHDLAHDLAKLSTDKTWCILSVIEEVYLFSFVSHLQFQLQSIWKCMIWHKFWQVLTSKENTAGIFTY